MGARGLSASKSNRACSGCVARGKRFFPDGVRLDLDLIEERRFGSGAVVLRYDVRC